MKNKTYYSDSTQWNKKTITKNFKKKFKIYIHIYITLETPKQILKNMKIVISIMN